MSTKTILTLTIAAVVFLIGGVVGCQTHAYFNPAEAVPLIGKSDTIIKRDTITVNIPYPVQVEPAGVVTVTPRKDSDTAQIAANGPAGISTPPKDDKPVLKPSGDVDIPITKKTYSGPDFYAVVSGWRPSLDSLQVFPKTVTVTNTQPVRQRSTLSITVGPTALYDGKVIRGGVGITAGFTILAR